jgi:hypothetical protein
MEGVPPAQCFAKPPGTVATGVLGRRPLLPVTQREPRKTATHTASRGRHPGAALSRLNLERRIMAGSAPDPAVHVPTRRLASK